jgi:hypothetical protein
MGLQLILRLSAEGKIEVVCHFGFTGYHNMNGKNNKCLLLICCLK